jgi:hypothetical protein
MARIMLRQGARVVHDTGERLAHCACEEAMRERLMIPVTFDPQRGYVTTGGEMLALTALSLSGLRRQLEDAHRGADIEIRLILDKRARMERDQRRRGGAARVGDYSSPR